MTPLPHPSDLPDLPGPAVLDALLVHAREVALACGRLVIDERPRDLGVGTKSTANDIVTVMDHRSEERARDELRRRRPGDGSLGEEGLDHEGTTGLTWVVDPIDGTVNYLYELPAFAVSVGVVVGDPRVEGAWYPVAGAVYNPLVDELFYARRGGGAWIVRGSGTPQALSARSPVPLEAALVGTGFSYDAAERGRQGAVVAALLPLVRDIRRFGAASLELCSVAAGRLDAYFERSLNAWDIAAGWVVAEEAGAVVKGLGSSRPNEAATLVGRPAVVADLEDTLVPLVDAATPPAPR